MIYDHINTLINLLDVYRWRCRHLILYPVNKINFKLLETAIQLTLTIHGNNSKNLFIEPTHKIEIL